MQVALIRLVWRRARDCCEYCQMPQAFDRTPFEIDHIISEKHNGRTIANNLCLIEVFGRIANDVRHHVKDGKNHI
jgi:hypothetical protein